MKKPKIETIANEGTFIVNVKCRQNNTWQGTINWVDKNETVPFRSMLEMIKLIDSALEGDETTKLSESMPGDSK